MKLKQIIHDESGTHRIYECEVCGSTLTVDTDILKCSACRIWAEDIAEEMEDDGR